MLISENKSMVHVFERVSVSGGKRKFVSFGFTVRRPPVNTGVESFDLYFVYMMHYTTPFSAWE